MKSCEATHNCYRIPPAPPVEEGPYDTIENEGDITLDF